MNNVRVNYSHLPVDKVAISHLPEPTLLVSHIYFRNKKSTADDDGYDVTLGTIVTSLLRPPRAPYIDDELWPIIHMLM